MSLLEKVKVTQAFWKAKELKNLSFGLILGSGLGVSWLKKLKTQLSLTMRIFQTGDNRRLSDMLENLFTELCLDVRFWLFRRFTFYEESAWSVLPSIHVLWKAHLDVKDCCILMQRLVSAISTCITTTIFMTGQSPLIGENLDDFGRC